VKKLKSDRFQRIEKETTQTSEFDEQTSEFLTRWKR